MNSTKSNRTENPHKASKSQLTASWSSSFLINRHNPTNHSHASSQLLTSHESSLHLKLLLICRRFTRKQTWTCEANPWSELYVKPIATPTSPHQTLILTSQMSSKNFISAIARPEWREQDMTKENAEYKDRNVENVHASEEIRLRTTSRWGIRLRTTSRWRRMCMSWTLHWLEGMGT